MRPEVRRAQPADGPLLKELRLAALLDSPFAFGSTYDAEANLTDEEWTLRATRSSSGNDSVLFLAWLGGRPSGIVGGYRPGQSVGAVELVSMWTAPHARRTGLGRLLVQAILDWAAETRSTSVGLWVTHGNTPAHMLYESLGFHQTGEFQPLPSDPCKDEIRMSLSLIVV
jgi:GNAT superfamily N-acetyltransferase